MKKTILTTALAATAALATAAQAGDKGMYIIPGATMSADAAAPSLSAGKSFRAGEAEANVGVVISPEFDLFKAGAQANVTSPAFTINKVTVSLGVSVNAGYQAYAETTVTRWTSSDGSSGTSTKTTSKDGITVGAGLVAEVYKAGYKDVSIRIELYPEAAVLAGESDGNRATFGIKVQL